jgi:type I restriction enzyme M protein
MLTDASLRSQVDALWDKLWSGGLSNPLDAIEQLSFLLFLKRLDERDEDIVRGAKRTGSSYEPLVTDPDLRWSYWTQLPADDITSRRKSFRSSEHWEVARGRSLSKWKMPNSRSTSPVC